MVIFEERGIIRLKHDVKIPVQIHCNYCSVWKSKIQKNTECREEFLEILEVLENEGFSSTTSVSNTIQEKIKLDMYKLKKEDAEFVIFIKPLPV